MSPSEERGREVVIWLTGLLWSRPFEFDLGILEPQWTRRAGAAVATEAEERDFGLTPQIVETERSLLERLEGGPE